MLLFELLAEQKICEAVSRGELEGLPGAGRPLDLEDDALVPEDLRIAYRILRNAGYTPGEVHDDAAGSDKVALIRSRIERLRMAAECRRDRRRGKP
ncbi:MAG: DnaJ family domain-containing protein [Betaproteobacteria bacterium]